ncbi:hypothetical protein [Brachybacterium sp. GU-2]|uniref:hypothetical protein n=1 Tax=Brachybacterium sp. GU-2 TaxID=3069708 RepID=UPI00280B9239|nr:hypothetical protein [Brachybacterium sp. GU-2]WME22402.1 hypothetical protein RBL05_12820 [Brachybacterium sp. GU-2]
MSVRRTVAQSSAGLLLLAAFAAGPTAVYAAPGGPSDGGGDGEQPTACEENAIPQVTITPGEPKVGDEVTFIGQCFPINSPAQVTVINDETQPLAELVAVGKDGSFSYTYSAAIGGDHRYQIEVNGSPVADGSFAVAGEDSEDTGENEGGDSDNPDGGEGGGSDGGEGGDDNGSGDDGEDPSDPGDGGEQGGEGSDSGDDGQEPGDTGQNPGDDEASSGNDSDTADDSSTGGGSTTDDDQGQDTGNDGESGNTAGSDEEQQQGGNATDSSSPTKPFPGDEEGGETSASSANGNAASRGSAPAQPPAAPGSATNDFPAAQQEATADQKQSAALAVLMTKLFAGGVSSGSVGTTPDQARTVIDPSADASEIEVPAGSDNGGSSDDGSGSETSGGDALAATGSNMLVPAGIAAAAILLGAGLKIHQIRRGL